MKIADITIDPCNLPKEDPTWRFALAANPLSEGWVVTITAEDGTKGYGYASSMPHYGAPLDAVKVSLDHFATILPGRNCRHISEIMTELESREDDINQARAAIDCALHDLLARQLQVPLSELFGGPCREEFASLRILAIKSPADMAASARTLMDKGVRHFKIKVHGDVEEDIARVAAIREEVGKDAHLTIDANQSYTPENAIAAITAMAAFGIDLAEQPVPADDIAGLKKVTRAVPVPVEADEAAFSLAQVMALVRAEAVNAVSLKITKLGGLRNTVAAAGICAAAGVRYRIGAHVGPRLIAAHAMHMAAALPHIWYACELTEFDRLLDDPFEGVDVENGVIRLTHSPGVGVNPRSDGALARKAG